MNSRLWMIGIVVCTMYYPKLIAQQSDVQLRAVREVIEAVNEKSPEKYVRYFADSVQIFVEDKLRLSGKQTMMQNRAEHFRRFPRIRSEIQHLVEIENKVVLHDKVWLDTTDTGRDIVEIFTFEHGKIVRITVIQPTNLLKR